MTVKRTFSDRCRCDRCGAFVPEEEGGPCRACGSAIRRLCDGCYDGYLEYESMRFWGGWGLSDDHARQARFGTGAMPRMRHYVRSPAVLWLR